MDMDREDSDEAKVAAMGQVLAMGESCWVKVVEIKEAEPGSDRGPKLSCSIKLVSQRDGTDLDPHGLKFRPKPVDSEFGQRRTVGSDAGRVQQGRLLSPAACCFFSLSCFMGLEIDSLQEWADRFACSICTCEANKHRLLGRLPLNISCLVDAYGAHFLLIEILLRLTL